MCIKGSTEWYDKKIGGNNINRSGAYHPPKKNIIKCILDITKCRYSANSITASIGPLYSVE